MIDIADLNKYGFIIQEYPLAEDLRDLDSIASYLLTYIPKILSVKGEKLYYDIDTIEKGGEIKPHYHIIPGSFQVVCWFPNGLFKGRDFLYGSSAALRRFKPKRGFMCFMKPNDSNFIHGVSELLSDESISTLGFSSLCRPFEEGMSNDIFIHDYTIID